MYIVYRSEIHWNGIRTRLLFEIHSSFSISHDLLVSSFFYLITEKSIHNSLFFLFYSLGFYFFEGYLIYTKSKKNILRKKIALYETSTGKSFDKRTKYQILKDQQQKDPNTVLTVFPQTYQTNKEVFELLPKISGISRSMTIYCNENGYFSNYFSENTHYR